MRAKGAPLDQRNTQRLEKRRRHVTDVAPRSRLIRPCLVALDLEAPCRPAVAERHHGRTGDGHDTWDVTHALDHVFKELLPDSVVRVLGVRQRDIEREQPIGIEAGRHPLQLGNRLDQQSRADEERQREGDLADDQDSPQEPPGYIRGSGPPTLLEGLVQVRP